MKTRKNNIDHLRQMTFEWTLFRERVKILLTDHRIRVVGFPKVNTKYTEIQTKQKLDKKKKFVLTPSLSKKNKFDPINLVQITFLF